jgi:hypothetical protein
MYADHEGLVTATLELVLGYFDSLPLSAWLAMHHSHLSLRWTSAKMLELKTVGSDVLRATVEWVSGVD